jgi:hypothetical protein
VVCKAVNVGCRHSQVATLQAQDPILASSDLVSVIRENHKVHSLRESFVNLSGVAMQSARISVAGNTEGVTE